MCLYDVKYAYGLPMDGLCDLFNRSHLCCAVNSVFLRKERVERQNIKLQVN